MKFTFKIFFFAIIFSLVFYALHESDFYSTKVILADLGGIPWLYASIGTLFSILAGFIIQKEWENWNSLIDAVSGEVNILREMWLWSRYLPAEANNIFYSSIKLYLEEMSDNGLQKSEQEIASSRVEEAMSKLNTVVFNMFKNQPELASNTFAFITKLIEKRAERIRYSSHHVPKSIKNIIFLATSLMICLSMFIGVKNIWLDYTYTMSVSMLTYVIFLVIDDLDHPLMPGGWHLTSKPYKKLLEKISMSKQN